MGRETRGVNLRFPLADALTRARLRGWSVIPGNITGGYRSPLREGFSRRLTLPYLHPIRPLRRRPVMRLIDTYKS